MSVYNKDNKFLAYLIILVSLFVIVFITKSQFSLMQENLDSLETYKSERDEKKSKLKDLNEAKNKTKIQL